MQRPILLMIMYIQLSLCKAVGAATSKRQITVLEWEKLAVIVLTCLQMCFSTVPELLKLLPALCPDLLIMLEHV